MNGRGLFDKAMILLGYASADGISGEEDILPKALVLINSIYAELYGAFVQKQGDKDSFVPLANINDNLNLPPYVANDIAPWGVAMLLAQSENDADSQTLFANLYNQKKVRGKKFGRVKNAMPHVWG